jgi:hypothetical protein
MGFGSYPHTTRIRGFTPVDYIVGVVLRRAWYIWHRVEKAPAFRRRIFAVAALFVLLGLTGRATPQQPVGLRGAIAGVVTAERGSVVLAGADVTVTDSSDRVVARSVTGEDGRFRIAGVAAGRYRVEAVLDGFRRTSSEAFVDADRTVEVAVDLPIAPIEQVVQVTQAPQAGILSAADVAQSQTLDGQTIDEMDGVQGAMRLLAGVLQTPAGLSIKGGRPTQTGLLLGNADVTDPATGAGPFRLPGDAVASIDVLSNPQAVEFGRFTTGVAVLGTRNGTDRWHARLSNFVPSLRTERNNLTQILGIERFEPRASVGGPLVKDRLFFSQSAEYRYEDLNNWSRPTTDVMSGRAINTFTRLDANMANGHRLSASLTLLRHNATAINMDAFTPPSASADVREDGVNALLSDSTVLSMSTLLDSVVQMTRYTQAAFPNSDSRGGLVLAPQGNTGAYFGIANRDTSSVQWIETLTKFLTNQSGEHAIKAGFDLLHANLHGTTNSAPVTIRRVDGTLARRLSFDGPASQAVTSTDVALFAQDRWGISSRVRLEGGARLDRDGTLQRLNGSMRIGGAALLSADEALVLRAGLGRFFNRTPLLVGAFESLDEATDLRFASDGITPIAPPDHLTHRVTDPLVTPRSDAWNVGVERRIGARMQLQANYFDRRGTHEFIVDPAPESSGSALWLSSNGRSTYRDVELSGDYASQGQSIQVRASYTRSMSKEDTNSYLSMFGALRAPVIPQNVFDVASMDVPHRFVGRLRWAPTTQWLLSPVLEFRSGSPYFPVDEYLDVVPMSVRPRYPAVTLLDVRVDRKVRVLKWQPWIGFAVNNALNEFRPTDVQANITAPNYGGFFGGQPRQFRVLVRFN